MYEQPYTCLNFLCFSILILPETHVQELYMHLLCFLNFIIAFKYVNMTEL
jgi:hypothetical protein